MAKIEVSLDYVHRLLSCGSIALVTSHFKGRDNIVTLSWQSPISARPKLFGLSIASKHFSNRLIRKSKELSINIPGSNMIREVHICGSCSGRLVDKFSKTGLSRTKAKLVKSPLIKECFANIECRVFKAYNIGDHTLFIVEPLAVLADSRWFDGKFLKLKDKGIETLHHLGKDLYLASGAVMRAR
jgi:flavin reductase (DIM6/NTAB) family NADH-FMN oxidoreductase RutF